jgi:hypothetical protein
MKTSQVQLREEFGGTLFNTFLAQFYVAIRRGGYLPSGMCLV